MSLIRYCNRYALVEKPNGVVFDPESATPVIPLDALRGVVEGLKKIVDISKEPMLPMAESCALMRDEAQRLLAQLEEGMR